MNLSDELPECEFDYDEADAPVPYMIWKLADETGVRLQKTVAKLAKLAEEGESMALRQLAFIACKATRHLNRIAAKTETNMVHGAITELSQDRFDWPLLVDRRKLESRTRLESWKKLVIAYFDRIGLSSNRPDRGCIGSKLQFDIRDDLSPVAFTDMGCDRSGDDTSRHLIKTVEKSKRNVTEEAKRTNVVMQWLMRIDWAWQIYNKRQSEAKSFLQRRRAVEKELLSKKAQLSKLRESKKTRRSREASDLEYAIEQHESHLDSPIGYYAENYLLTQEPEKWLERVWKLRGAEVKIFAEAVKLPRFPRRFEDWWNKVFKPYADLHAKQVPGWDRIPKNQDLVKQKHLERVRSVLEALSKGKIGGKSA